MTAGVRGARSALWNKAFSLIRDHGLEHRTSGFVLSSGMRSTDYIDGKRAISDGERLAVVCRAICELADTTCMDFTAVGGMTMGADPLAIGVAALTGCGWFSVRKARKDHGCEQWIEGTRLGSKSRVLLVDDVVSTGNSMLSAMDRVLETGASVVGAVPMVNRSEVARLFFSQRGVLYCPLVTYIDLGIDPVN
jgi:orotate phosphoribosyltransferase